MGYKAIKHVTVTLEVTVTLTLHWERNPCIVCLLDEDLKTSEVSARCPQNSLPPAMGEVERGKTSEVWYFNCPTLAKVFLDRDID